MRQPDELDYVQLMDAVERKAAANPGACVSVTSPTYGALCGFVPREITSEPVRLVLSDGWFNPYLRD